MQEENLTDENFMVLCAKYYRNIQCLSTEEFLSDIKRLKYIKKLLTRYNSSKVLDERLILNHLIILNNVFGSKFLSRILYLKMLPNMIYLKPFLLFLNILPDVITNVNGNDYETASLPMDWSIVAKLEEILKQSIK